MSGDSETKVEAPKKKKSKKLLIIGLIVFILAVGAGALFMLKGQIFGMAEKPPEEQAEEEKVASLTFEGIQVNLADQNSVHYLSTTIVLEYAEDEKLGEELKEKSYRLKDAIIGILRSKSVGELDTGEDIDKVKQEITADVNKELTLGKVNSVYFEAFIIQ